MVHLNSVGIVRSPFELSPEAQLQSQKKIIISRFLDSDQKMIRFLFEPNRKANLRERPEIRLYESWEFPSPLSGQKI
ncbi:MAG: hypothetical protein B7Y39_01965 [Bdellovibrio sp. 28-41-41]|nr:MAG: hypothetical protein B7Y39_01965 [Bdellovibrio sp. 28-41-41]